LQPEDAQLIFDEGDMSVESHIHAMATRLNRPIVTAALARTQGVGQHVVLRRYGPGYGVATTMSAAEARTLADDASVIWLRSGGLHFSAFASAATRQAGPPPCGASGLGEIPSPWE
jgi:hypothetical protein